MASSGPALQKIQIQLSLKGDGPQPEPLTGALGHYTTGPHGFLNLLETQLGITTEDTPFTRRLIQYLACIEEVHHPEAFYYASYQADPFSAARTLLQWRDQWYLSGWQGEFAGKCPARLADMAAIELLAKGSVDHNQGQRMQTVLALLAEQRDAHEAGEWIASIELHDALTDFPALWQQLIKAVKAPITEVALEAPSAKAKTDLHRLQAYLLEGSTGGLELTGDNTVVALTAGVASDSAVVIAAHASELAKNNQTLAVLAEVRGALLDEAFESLRAPRLGFHALSSARPLFQVLPLACELLWEPLDPQALLQFLSHPFGPLPGKIRLALAQCVASTPGVGGEAWHQTISEVLEKYPTDRQGSLAGDIGYWLQSPRTMPNKGVAYEVLTERAQRVLDWLLAVREGEDDSAGRGYFAVAINQVQEFILAIERLRHTGREQLTRDNVLRLIDDVRGSGAAVADRHAEVAEGRVPICRAEHSGAFHQPIEQVIWWDCQASDHVARWPWSMAERDALLNAGVQLQSENQQLAWLGRAWQRPILCASERCLLVLHHDVDRHHPVWDQLTANITGLPMLAINSPEAEALLVLQFDALPVRALPQAKRWWQLPAHCEIKARKSESYSSLDAFIYSPYQWLLRYGAKIWPGSLLELSDGNLLRGNIAHHLVEIFFAEHTAIQSIAQDGVGAWVDEHLPTLLEQEGAPLLAPGRQAECQQFNSRVREAMQSLVQHLQQANVVSVQTELYQNAFFCGGELGGYIDLLAVCESGDEIIVDVKWGGRRYRRDALRDGNYLQLATYAHMRVAATPGASPRLSYFIVDDAQMLSLDHELFPNAECVKAGSGENWAELWRRFEITWRWRNEQHQQGLFEVTVTNTEPDEHSQAPAEGLTIKPANDNFNDYAVLTGWDANA